MYPFSAAPNPHRIQIAYGAQVFGLIAVWVWGVGVSLLPGSRFSMMKVACTNPAGTPLVAGTGFGVHRDG